MHPYKTQSWNAKLSPCELYWSDFVLSDLATWPKFTCSAQECYCSRRKAISPFWRKMYWTDALTLGRHGSNCEPIDWTPLRMYWDLFCYKARVTRHNRPCAVFNCSLEFVFKLRKNTNTVVMVTDYSQTPPAMTTWPLSYGLPRLPDRHVAIWSWYREWLHTALCQNRFLTSWSSNPPLTWRKNIDWRSYAIGGKETRLPLNLSVTWVPNSLFVVQTFWAVAFADSWRDCGQRTSKYGTQVRHRTGNLLIKNYDSDSCPAVYTEAEVNPSLYGQNVTKRRYG